MVDNFRGGKYTFIESLGALDKNDLFQHGAFAFAIKRGQTSSVEGDMQKA